MGSGRAGQSIRVQTIHPDASSEAATAADLRTLYEAHGYEVTASSQDTAHRLAAERTQRMNLIFVTFGVSLHLTS